MQPADQFPSSLPAKSETISNWNEDARDRLIVALDVPTAAAALKLVGTLKNCHWFKVGMELFTAAGPRLVQELVASGHSVFLDLKFHDIPNTVAGAVRSAAGLGVRMMTLHGLGGPAMLSAAQKAVEGIKDPPQLLAVTVLTSMDAQQLEAIGLAVKPAEEVQRLARMGLDAGIHGFVCSPEEVAALRQLGGEKAVLVIPGIRPAGASVGDQKRVATPAEALQMGASYLVVGRPITQAADPAEAAERVLAEMVEGLKG